MKRLRSQPPFHGLKRLFHLGRFRPDPERDLDSELDFHFRETVEELQRQGMSPGEAQAEAEHRFGDRVGHRARLEHIDAGQLRMRRAEEFFFILRQNLSHALRSLRRSPGFAAAVISILTLGIWANAVMFGILDRILFQPPAHIENHQQIRRVYSRFNFQNQIVTSNTMSYPDFAALKDMRAFTSVAAYTGLSTATVGRGEDALRAMMITATPEFMSLLGADLFLGRFFSPADDSIGAPLTAVIGYGFWRRCFGSNPDVIGRTIDLGVSGFNGGSAPATIIGVTPAGFTGVGLSRIDMLLPVQPTRVLETGRSSGVMHPGLSWLQIVARLNPDQTEETAAHEASLRHRQAQQAEIDAGRWDAEARIVLEPLITARGTRASREVMVSRWLAGVSLIVLLIACANVANLILARAEDRRREVAVRLSLGVSRSRLIGQMITESLVLSFLAGGLALVLAGASAGFIRNILLPHVSWPHSPVNGRIIAFTLLAVLVSAVAAGFLPALQTVRPSLSDALKGGERSSSGRRSRLRFMLQTVQGALSVILLIGAGLFLRSLEHVHTLDLGLDVNRLAMVTLEMEEVDASKTILNHRYEHAAERIRRIPGVEGVGITSTPFGWRVGFPVTVPGRDSDPNQSVDRPQVNFASPGYCRVLGLRFLSGRGIRAGDGPGGERILVVNELLAETLWPGENAVGRQVLIGDPDRGPTPLLTVVGVVENATNEGLTCESLQQFYLPLAEAPDYATGYSYPAAALYVRSRSDPRVLFPQIRREASAADDNIRYAEIEGVREMLDSQARSWRLGATLFTAFGLLALVVAVLGLYSTLACDIARRTRELGIRTALGADRGSLIGLVMKMGLRLTLIGLGLGFAVILAAARFVQPLLFEVSATDPLVYGAIAATLILTALAAAAIPAWRVSRLDPVTALRVE